MIASYFGTLVYREALEPGTDRSYIVRLPDAGGALANGKAFADAIRANPDNPREDGCYYPVEGAPEWHVGAGAMANDPMDRNRYNARLDFVKRAEIGPRSLRELTPMRPVLIATRDLEVH